MIGTETGAGHLKLLEDGRICGSLKVSMFALTLLVEDPSPDEGGQFTLSTRRGEVQMSGQFPHIPPALRLDESGCEDRLPSLGEQSVHA
jgi:hypothetical protein